MKILKTLSIVIVLNISFISNAQNATVDSLKLLLNNSKQDTIKLRILFLLTEECELNEIMTFANPALKIVNQNLNNKNNLSSNELKNIINLKGHIYSNIGFYYENEGNLIVALKYYDTSLIAFNKINYTVGIISTYIALGALNANIQKFNIALNYYEKAFNLSKKINNQDYEAEILNNIGTVYSTEGMTIKALEYYTRSLKLAESINNLEGISYSNLNIAGCYSVQKDYVKALECLNKSCMIYEKTNNKYGISSALNKIGNIYAIQSKYAVAEDFFNKSLKISEQIGNKEMISTLYQNIASLSIMKGDTIKYNNYIEKSIPLLKQNGDFNALAVAYRNKAFIMFKQYIKENKIKTTLKLAIKYSDSALSFANISKNLSSISECELTHSQIDSAFGDYIKSYNHYKQHIFFKDSINNINIRKLTIRNELKYEYEKKAAADSVKVGEEKKLITVKLKQEQTQRYYLYGGLGLTVLFGVFMFNRFRITQKQKNVIEEQKTLVETQKHIVDEKQKEILDSIRYAKRIQQSLLPTEKYIYRILKNNSR